MLDFDSTHIQDLDGTDAVRTALVDRIRSAVRNRPNGSPRVVRETVPLPVDVHPMDWIRAQVQSEAAYWSGRDDEWGVAMVGAADVVTSTGPLTDYSKLRRDLKMRLGRPGAPVRYYGGLRFDAASPQGPEALDRTWAPFGTYRFVLPRFELVHEEGTLALACNLVLPRDAGHLEGLVDSIEALHFPSPEPPTGLPQPFGRTDVPGQSGWNRAVCWALDAISRGALDKVVLARRVSLDFRAALDPFLVLHHLEEATPGCFHFAFRPADGPAFVGASPERLFYRHGEQVVSEAVAGTRARGPSPEADAVLRRELLNSPKDRREHAFVQKAIRGVLEAHCREVDVPKEPSDFALARGRHLRTRLRGILRSGVTTVDLLDALHPTPAVGGVPAEDALKAIREQEPFDRGWYAGPVGWIGADSADLAVALRSGLVQDSSLGLFSGAGIVDGSEPEKEWSEIEQKIGDFAAVLGLDGPVS